MVYEASVTTSANQLAGLCYCNFEFLYDFKHHCIKGL